MTDKGFAQIVQHVRDANDLVEVVAEHVALKRSGRGFVGLCPFHQEKTPSFHVNPEGFFKCFGCGAGGDVFKFIQRTMGVEFREALELLARRASIDLDRYRARPTGGGPSRTEIYRANAWAAEVFRRDLWQGEPGAQARAYLIRRKLGEPIVKEFGLGFAASDGRTLLQRAGRAGIAPSLLSAAGLVVSRQGEFQDLFRRRLIFPIVDATGNVEAFGGRTLGDDQPKYLNSPETPVFRKSKSFFGLYPGRKDIQSSGRVVIVEGYTDCLAAHAAGIRNVVATLGTALTEEHVAILRRYAEEIVLVFDGDEAGLRAGDRALGLFLTMGVDVKLATLPEGQDPCDFVIEKGGEAFAAVIASAKPALEYKWERVQRAYDGATTLAARRAAVDELLAVVASCDPAGKVDAIQRGMVLSRLSAMLSIPMDELGRSLGRFRRRPAQSRVRSGGRPVPAQPSFAVETAGGAACRELLEVLICEPGHLADLPEWVSPERFEPPALRRVAEVVWQAHELWGEFSVSELLGLVEDVGLADIITELYREGERRGNFDGTFREALRCLEDHDREVEAKRLAAGLSAPASEEDVDRQLRLLQRNLTVPLRRTPGAMVD